MLCKKCNKDKPNTEFHKQKRSLSGFQHVCKKCNIKRAKQHYKNNSDTVKKRTRIYQNIFRNAVDKIKRKYTCCFCSMDNQKCLDFHHTDYRTKLYNICKLTQCKNSKIIVDEINKCVVICANCHRLLHYKELVLDNISNVNETYESFNQYLIECGNKHVVNSKPSKSIKQYNLCICGYKKHATAKLCSDCHKLTLRVVDRPSSIELEELLSKYNYTKVGKMFGVSDNTIRKWQKYYQQIMYYI